MKKNLLILLLVVVMFAGACSKKTSGKKILTDADSVAYVIGMNIAANLRMTDSTLNLAAVCEGIRDVERGKTRLTQEEARAYFLRYMNYMLPEKALRYEEEFLEEFAKSNRSYARTKSGVTYTVAEIGDQELVPMSDRDSVVMRMVIRTADDREIYSSYERGDSLRSKMSDLVSGLRESLRLVGEGGRISAWLPAREAYGAEGNDTLGVKPNATLFYEIELLDVEKFSNRKKR